VKTGYTAAHQESTSHKANTSALSLGILPHSWPAAKVVPRRLKVWQQGPVIGQRLPGSGDSLFDGIGNRARNTDIGSKSTISGIPEI
jgi:hypothetical protein